MRTINTPPLTVPPAGIDARAAKVGRLDLDVLHLVDRAGEDVAVEHDEVGELARLERSLLLLLERQERVVDRVEADGLLARQILLGMQRRIAPARLADDRRPHAEERVVGVDRAQAADLLHVIGAAADRHALLEERAIGLEVGEPLVAEVLAKRRAVEVEPGRLHVGDDAQRLHLRDRLRAHEVGVRDARAAGRAPESRPVDALVGVDHRVDRPVALRVGRELQVVRERELGDLVELLGLDEPHAAVLGIVDRVDLADAPRLAHVGAAGQHAAVEEDLDAAQPQHVVVLVQRTAPRLRGSPLRSVSSGAWASTP